MLPAGWGCAAGLAAEGWATLPAIRDDAGCRAPIPVRKGVRVGGAGATSVAYDEWGILRSHPRYMSRRAPSPQPKSAFSAKPILSHQNTCQFEQAETTAFCEHDRTADRSPAVASDERRSVVLATGHSVSFALPFAHFAVKGFPPFPFVFLHRAHSAFPSFIL